MTANTYDAPLVTVAENTDLEEAKHLLHQHRIEKLVVVDDDDQVRTTTGALSWGGTFLCTRTRTSSKNASSGVERRGGGLRTGSVAAVWGSRFP